MPSCRDKSIWLCIKILSWILEIFFPKILLQIRQKLMDEALGLKKFGKMRKALEALREKEAKRKVEATPPNILLEIKVLKILLNIFNNYAFKANGTSERNEQHRQHPAFGNSSKQSANTKTCEPANSGHALRG